jgi:chemotaxis protein MotB
MRKKHPEHVNLERWLVSYADFMTLLFALFVVMYAMAQADKAKAKIVVDSLRKAFSAGPVGMVNVGGTAGGSTANVFENPESAGGRAQNLPAGKTNTAADPDPELQEIRELLEETISLELGANDAAEKLQMQFDSRGLIIRVATKDFFDEGSIEVRPDLRPILDRIGRVLAKMKRLIRIEGHTDRGEAQASKYPSGWELSAARAAWVAKYWIQKFNFNPSRMGIAGYGDHRPLSSGKKPWDRAKNRRVEVIILNNLYEDP